MSGGYIAWYRRVMKLFAPLILALCLAMPAHGQDDAPAEDGLFTLMERMLRGFITEAEPQLRDLERGLTELEPELNRFLDRMRDMTRYHPPEVLPNGDILIRRRQAEDEGVPDASPESEPQPSPDGEPDFAPEQAPEPFEL